ncbi:MAG TPA: MmcQ/YjbR family DNA-binding protein [Candidatus Saccharimonadales bacterium]|nr:MmcQ/YjbR family DNA-binding protein [Candidatus Saccharimonadales bacterium]
MDRQTVETYLMSMPNARLEHPFGPSVAVFKIYDNMFALIREGKDPVQLSLKCDPQLAEVLRAKYAEVMPGYHLNKKYWNTMVLAGQLTWDEVQDLIRHSYNLAITNEGE